MPQKIYRQTLKMRSEGSKLVIATLVSCQRTPRIAKVTRLPFLITYKVA